MSTIAKAWAKAHIPLKGKLCDSCGGRAGAPRGILWMIKACAAGLVIYTAVMAGMEFAGAFDGGESRDSMYDNLSVYRGGAYSVIAVFVGVLTALLFLARACPAEPGKCPAGSLTVKRSRDMAGMDKLRWIANKFVEGASCGFCGERPRVSRRLVWLCRGTFLVMTGLTAFLATAGFAQMYDKNNILIGIVCYAITLMVAGFAGLSFLAQPNYRLPKESQDQND